MPIDDPEVLDQQLAAERGLGELDGQELDVGAMLGHRGEVRGRCDPKAGFPAVWDDRAAPIGGDPADAQGLGQAADPPDVGLQHIDQSPVGEVEEFEMRVLPLPGGDRDRRPVVEEGVTLQVVDVDRRLDEFDPVWGEPLDHTQGRRGIGPGVGHVDHEDEVRTDRTSALGDDLDDGVIVFLQAVVAVGPVDADLQFGGAIAEGPLLFWTFATSESQWSWRVRPAGRSEA